MDTTKEIKPQPATSLSIRNVWPRLELALVALLMKFMEVLASLRMGLIFLWQMDATGLLIVFRRSIPQDRPGFWKDLFLVALRVVLGRFLKVLVPSALANLTKVLFTPTATPEEISLALYRWLGFQYLRKAIVGFLGGIPTTDFELKLQGTLRLAAHRHAMALSANYHDKANAAKLNFVIDTAERVGYLFYNVVTGMLPILFDLATGSIVLWSQIGVEALFIATATALATVTSSAFEAQQSPKNEKDLYEYRMEQSKIGLRNVMHWREATIFNRIPEELKLYARNLEASTKLHEKNIRSEVGMAFIKYNVTFAGKIILALVMLRQVMVGTRTADTLIAAIKHWDSFIEPLNGLIGSYDSTHRCLTELRKVGELLQIQPTIRNKPGAEDLKVFDGRIELNNVSFGYQDGKANTIEGMSLIIEGGQRVALVGATGAGKTTILQLLLRLYDVSEGSILIDGHDIRDVTQESLHENVGCIMQRTRLLNETIADNVRFGREGASQEEIEAACHAAAIHDDIMEMPEGYQTKVGEDGSTLSGGQAQRIAIARVFLQNPRIILLDEATNALDSEKEAQIQKSFDRLFKDRTVIIVAHRLNTIKACDVIFVVEDGRIQESGSHTELHEAHERYWSLWETQFVS